MPLTSTDRQDRNNAIFDHRLAGETTTEIAKRAQIDHTSVVRVISMVRASRLEAMHISETPPVYNVWNYQSCDKRFTPTHVGNTLRQSVLPKVKIASILPVLILPPFS